MSKLLQPLLFFALVVACTAQSGDDSTLKVEVKLVNVFTTVTDANGAPIAGLKKEDFKIFEDGVPQTTAVFARQSNLPLSIVLAVDSSLSTRDDLKFELHSARAFVRDVLDPSHHDALSLYQFERDVKELVPFTSSLREIDGGIDRVKVGSSTALYDAIYLASQSLQDRQGRKVLVVITDGGDTASSVSYHEALRRAQQAEAILYSIIIVPIEASPGRNTGGEHALIQLSRDTGGKYYYAASTPQLDRAFQQISEELRTQYLLAYYPKQRLADSDFRRIEVQVSPQATVESLTVRHRAGYYTSKPE
jgi:Ca-activated chloride channel family protein